MQTRLLTKALATVQAHATAKHVTVQYLLHQLLNLTACECGRCTPQEAEEKEEKKEEIDLEEEEEEAKAEEQEEDEADEAEEEEQEPHQRDELLYRESAFGEHKVTHTNTRSPRTQSDHDQTISSPPETEDREQESTSSHNTTSLYLCEFIEESEQKAHYISASHVECETRGVQFMDDSDKDECKAERGGESAAGRHRVDHFSDAEVEAWFDRFCGREGHSQNKRNIPPSSGEDDYDDADDECAASGFVAVDETEEEGVSAEQKSGLSDDAEVSLALFRAKGSTRFSRLLTSRDSRIGVNRGSRQDWVFCCGEISLSTPRDTSNNSSSPCLSKRLCVQDLWKEVDVGAT